MVRVCTHYSTSSLSIQNNFDSSCGHQTAMRAESVALAVKAPEIKMASPPAHSALRRPSQKERTTPGYNISVLKDGAATAREKSFKSRVITRYRHGLALVSFILIAGLLKVVHCGLFLFFNHRACKALLTADWLFAMHAKQVEYDIQ